MNEDAHAHPNSATISLKPQFKVCSDCRANRPLEAFGLAKYSKDHRSGICHECRAQYLRIRRRMKYGAKPKDEEIIRSVAIHNAIVLDDSLSTRRSVIGFQIETKREFRVVFQIGTLGMKSMAIFDTEGATFREYSYSGVEDKPVLLGIIKTLGLRLEYTSAELIASKNVIYYL